LGSLDHEELLINRVIELQMKCFTNVFIKTSSNNPESENSFQTDILFILVMTSPLAVIITTECPYM